MAPASLLAASNEEVAAGGNGEVAFLAFLALLSMCTCVGVSVWLGIACMLASTLLVFMGACTRYVSVVCSGCDGMCGLSMYDVVTYVVRPMSDV